MLAVSALLSAPGAAQGRALPNAHPPVPGGTYQGQTDLGRQARIDVSTQGPSGTLPGTFTFPCANVTAPFTTSDGTFVARKLRPDGTVAFRAEGRFAAVDRTIGRITKVAASGSCAPSPFDAKLTSPAGVQSKTIRYGPFNVDPMPMGGDPQPMTFVRSNLQRPCSNCYVIGMVPELTYANGSVANWDTDAMLHHAVLFNRSSSDASCRGWPERFFASGNERTDFVIPKGFGYRVTPNANWSLLAELMNMADQMQTFYVQVRFYYVNAPAPFNAVRPLWLDIDNCGNSEYSIPAGLSDTHWNYPVPSSIAGNIVAMGGHVHDDGVRTQTTRGLKSICNSRAGYGTNPDYMGHIESMTGCVGKPLAQISAGDTLRLHSIYDSPTAQNDVMGIMLAFVDPGS